jgi:hypothetical protein
MEGEGIRFTPKEIAETILKELHNKRYNEAISNGCNEKEAIELADNSELYKGTQNVFKFICEQKLLKS